MKKRNFLWLFALPFMLTGCQAGPAGPQGEKGETGQVGSDGVSVISIVKTSSEGNKDTYTIIYSNGTTSTFIVTNGVDGSQGIQGIPGKDGHSPVISIGSNGNWYVDGVDTGTKAQGPKGDKGDTGAQGPQGPKGDKGDKGDAGKDAITYVPCIFNNYDGTKLYEFYYEKGSDIVYDGPTPTKTTIDEDGSTFNWSFTGWDKSLECIQKPTIFTAQFECLYTCTFVNYDGTVLLSKKVNRGESVVYDGPIPTRPSDVPGGQTTESWKFTGWDKSLDNIKCDTIFTAQFVDTLNAITIYGTVHAGTEADPLDNAGAIKVAKAVGTNETEKFFYVKGTVASFKDAPSSYGNVSYYLSSETSEKFLVYRAVMSKDLKADGKVTDDDIWVGAIVTAKVKIVNYNNSIPETSQGGEIVKVEGTKPEIKTHVVTVAEAVAATKELEENTVSVDKYVITGYIVDTDSQGFYIADTKGEIEATQDDFLVYGYSGENAAKCTLNAQVRVTCTLKYYVSTSTEGKYNVETGVIDSVEIIEQGDAVS